MRVICPTRDRHFVFHPASFFSIRSKIQRNLVLVTLPFIVGTPKYLPRSFVLDISSMLQIVVAWFAGTLGEKRTFDLEVLNFCPDCAQNCCRHPLIIPTCSSLASANRMMSSANSKLEISGPADRNWLPLFGGNQLLNMLRESLHTSHEQVR